MLYETFSPDQTEKIGFEMGQKAKSGDIYCLVGELGVGKTAFTQGFARGLGIAESIGSPTFTIINEYDNALPLYHFDVYRLGGADELYEIGCDEYFFGDGVCLVEWADSVRESIPKHAVWIKIQKKLEKGDDYRIIEVTEDAHIGD